MGNFSTRLKTILYLSTFRYLTLAFLTYTSSSLLNIDTFSVLFWLQSSLIQVLYMIVSLKDPGYWPLEGKTEKPESTFIVLIEERPLADQANIPTIKDENTPSDHQSIDLSLSSSSKKSLKNTRYCSTCKFSQPLRTKHCRECGRCINLYDHHCPWVGNCIGQNNRLYFFWYVFFQCSELWVAFYRILLCFHSSPSLGVWLYSNLLTLILFLVVLLFILMVTFLLFFHVFLALANLTTWEFLSWNKIEYLKERKRKVSPFSRGIFRNFFEYCCEKFPPFKQWELSPGSTIK